jgi:hypothetical protein
MSYAGLEALAGKGGMSPAKASSPVFIIHYSLMNNGIMNNELCWTGGFSRKRWHVTG